MKRKIAFLCFFLFVVNLFALRQVKVGESFKKDNLNSKILLNEKKIIVFLNGNKAKNEKMLKVLNSVLKKDSSHIKVIFVKTTETDYQGIKDFASNGNYMVVNDLERKLYGDLGVIVLPTVLFVNENQVLIAEIAGLVPNMKLIFLSYLKALKTNSVPEDIYDRFKKRRSLEKKEKSLRQAFLMFVNGNYEISTSIFARLFKKYPDDKRVILGYAYSLMLSGKPAQAKKILADLKQKNKREELALCYASFLEGGTAEDLKQCAENINFEPDFFSVIFSIGKEFEKRGMCEDALRCYKEAYKVLWKRYRRGK